MNKTKIIGVDLDGCLARGTSWTPDDCLKARVNHKLLDWIWKIEEGNIIIIYTARRNHLIPATIEWLKINNIPFHAISNNKIPLDLYVDNKAWNPDTKEPKL